MSGTLYVVATPIGNLEDISRRALRILQEVDLIAAEDTRSTQKLLSLLDIRGRTISNHKFNERGQAEVLVAKLSGGNNIALVSDAGTPCISDPGWALVDAAARSGIKTVGVCGPSALVTACSVSGFELDSFAFYGFFPRDKRRAAEFTERITRSDIRVSVCFESPLRIIKTMHILCQAIPDAQICLCNDLTKLHERIYRGAPSSVLAELEGNNASEKGEYTLVISTANISKACKDDIEGLSPEALIIDSLMKSGGSLRDAVADTHARHRGKYSRSELYDASLRLKQLAVRLSDTAGEYYDNK